MMILKLLLNIQMICKIVRKILKNNLEKKHKVLIVFDDMIVANMFNNKET